MNIRSKRSSTRPGRRVLWAVGSAAMLAAVILVASSLSSARDSGSTKEQAGFTPSLEAENLAQEARAAASALDTETAVRLANEALAIDPDNATARRIVGALVVVDPAPDTGTPGVSDAVTPAKYLASTKDIAAFLPLAVAGWSELDVVTQRRDALVTFEPGAGSPEYSSVTRVSVSVHDRKSTAGAETFVEKVSRRVYASDPGSSDLGAVVAYTGTDGSRLATVAFTRGRYAFEVIVTGRPGVEPESVVSVGVMVARLVPAAQEE